MSKVLVEGTTFAASITVPEDGDARNAASVEVPFQALTDRTRTLKNRMDSPEITATVNITSDQSDWSPTGWSTADVVRIDPDADRNILGVDSAATVKRKTLINLDTVFQLGIVHNDSGQAAGNKIICPNDANFYIGPRGSVDIVYDSVSAFWRVLEPSFVNASAFLVAGEPQRTVFVNLLHGMHDGNWSLGFGSFGSELATTTDGAVVYFPINIPSPCEITRVRAGLSVTGTPGGGSEPSLTLLTSTPNTSTGLTVVSTVGTVNGSAAAGSSVMTLSGLSSVTNNSSRTQYIGIAAASGGATATSINWVEIQFYDAELGNG